jgi:hypothetical protein
MIQERLLKDSRERDHNLNSRHFLGPSVMMDFLF